MKKFTRLRIQAMLFSACLFLLSTFGTAGVSAADGVSGRRLSEITYFVKKGASVRTVPGSSGLRFTAQMSYADYDGIMAHYDSLEFGMFILPQDYVTSYGVPKPQKVLSDTSDYCAKTSCSCEKVHIIHVKNTKLVKDAAGYYSFNGVITNILPNNITREFCGFAYVSGTKDGITEYKDAAIGEARSVAYVAQRALEEDKSITETQKSVLTQYVDSVANKFENYTVNYYLGNGANFELLQTVGGSGKISDIAEAEILPYDGYEYFPEISNSIGVIYANGRTELNIYYVKNSGTADLTDRTSYLHKSGGMLDLSHLFGNIKTIAGKSVNTKNKMYLTETDIESFCKVENPTGEFTWKVATDKLNYKITVCIYNDAINTVADFAKINADPNGYYILGGDIPAYGEQSLTGIQLNGVLDGCGHIISGLNVSSKGIFETISENATVKNIALNDLNCEKTVLSENFYGIIDGVYVQSANAKYMCYTAYDTAKLKNSIIILPSSKYMLNSAASGSAANNLVLVSGNTDMNDLAFDKKDNLLVYDNVFDLRDINDLFALDLLLVALFELTDGALSFAGKILLN